MTERTADGTADGTATSASGTEVLVVGACPTGLSAALALGRLGVRTTLVERSASTARHPQGHVENGRTMELFRLWGVEDAVRAQGLPPAFEGAVTVDLRGAPAVETVRARYVITADGPRSPVREGLGVGVDVRSTLRWRVHAAVARRTRDRWVFLAGDAAHTMPPTGGTGTNTGTADVLATVLHRAPTHHVEIR